MAYSPIDNLPAAPVRGEDRTTFANKANAWVEYMPTFTSQVNSAGDWVNEQATLMAGYVATSQASSEVAMGGANYKGAWSALTGALNMPASVSHGGLLYLLNTNLADVTLKTPGVDPEWDDYASFLSGTALLPAVMGTAGQMLKVNAAGTAYDYCSFTASDVLTLLTDTVAPGGDFTSGTIKMSKIGNVVTITLDGLVHPSGTSVLSAPGIIPEAYRPGANGMRIFVLLTSSVMAHIVVNSTGVLSIGYYNFSGSLTLYTGVSAASVSFVV